MNGFGDVFRTLEGLGATAGGIFFCVPGESFIFRPWKLLSMPCCVIFRILYENINNIVMKQKFQPMWALSIKWQPHKCPHFDLSTSLLINIKTWSFNLYLKLKDVDTIHPIVTRALVNLTLWNLATNHCNEPGAIHRPCHL